MKRHLSPTLIAISVLLALGGCGGGSSGSGSPSSTITSTSATSSSVAGSASAHARRRANVLTRRRLAEAAHTARLAAVEVKSFGTAAGAAEVAALARGLHAYLAAVEAREYAKACSLTITARQAPQRGKPCPTVLAETFKSGFYKGADASFPSLVVVGARTSEEAGGKGYALVARSASAKPEEFVAMRREGGVWKPAVFAPFPLDPKIALARYKATFSE